MKISKPSPYRLPVLLSAGVFALFLSPLGAISLDFQESAHTVAPGDQVTIVTAFADPVPNGLDSYYIRLNFAEGLLHLTEEDITVPAELDFGLFDPPAERSVSSGWAEIRGFAEVGAPYHGTAFVTFIVTVDSEASDGTYPLTLSIPQENSFVDGEQTVIDDLIVLGTATIVVEVPAPEIGGALSINPSTGGAVLHFRGLPHRTYRLDYSEDLSDWSPLAEVTADSEGDIIFEDPAAASLPRRFYRAANL